MQPTLGKSGKFDELRGFLRTGGLHEEFLLGAASDWSAPNSSIWDRSRRAPSGSGVRCGCSNGAVSAGSLFAGKAERLMGRDHVGLLSGMGLLKIDAGNGRCHEPSSL